ncbi:MAG: matrixin family metalloprotease [Acidobacteriota bacterium]
MKNLTRGLLCAALLLALLTLPLGASGNLETYNISAFAPGPFPGTVLAPLVDIKWDNRCISVPYVVNDVLDPIPNVAGGPPLDLATATDAFQEAFDAWNDIPTSYIDMQIVGTTTNFGERGFDMINELTFITPPGFPAIASSPSVSLIADSFFVDGDDIDGDGDSDVSSTLTTCGDADGDGDIEFPEGFYPAGTILDNDVQYSAATLGFTVGDANLTLSTNSVDLITVAVHEFGHSHGLSHTAINQISDTEGGGSTMFPSIDTGDPIDQINGRTPHIDDIAFSSLYYPEGTGTDPADPATLEPGDVPFDKVFTTVSGSVTDAFGSVIIGGSAFAENTSTGEVVSTAVTARGQLGFDLFTGGLFLLDLADSIVDDRYVIPVPKDRYFVGVEALDGFPVGGNQVNFTGIIGSLYGLQNFDEEYWAGPRESFSDAFTGPNYKLNANRPRTNINMVTDFNAAISAANGLDTFFLVGPGSYLAARIPISEIEAFDFGSGVKIQAMTFPTLSSDASTVPVFEAAYLAVGVDNGDGTASIDLEIPFRTEAPYVGQPADDGPVFFRSSAALGRQALGKVKRRGQDFFLVLKAGPNVLPGVSGLPPAVGVDVIDGSEVSLGRSFISNDGVSFNALSTINLPFRLVVAPIL